MPILDKSKLRPDVRKLATRSSKITYKGVFEFLDMPENKGVDLQELLQLVMGGNKQFFEDLAGGDVKVDDLYGRIPDDKMLFLARMYRYAKAFSDELNVKKHPIPKDVKIEVIDIDGVPAEWQINPTANEELVLLFFHGGGQVLGSAKGNRPLTVEIGKVSDMKVLSVDYRLAPENPYPAGLDDCVKVYKWLLSEGFKPENIIFGGASAGGNMTLATMLRARDEGLPLPKGGICLSPGIDYTIDNKSVLENAPTDPVMADIGLYWWIPAYLDGQDPYNPYISPVHSDPKGLPPILVQVSTCEMVYDHSTRFVERAKAAGVDAELQEWDDMPHVWQGYGQFDLPEAQEAIDKIGEFIKNL
jgi:acetyl esterase/lipase